MLVKNANEEKRFHPSKLFSDHNVVSGMSCVINHSEPPYGVISVHTKIEREFTKDDANFLVSIANLLSVALSSLDAREKLNASESKFRTLANAIPQLAWMANDKGDVFWYNQQWYDYTGLGLEEMKNEGDIKGPSPSGR